MLTRTCDECETRIGDLDKYAKFDIILVNESIHGSPTTAHFCFSCMGHVMNLMENLGKCQTYQN